MIMMLIDFGREYCFCGNVGFPFVNQIQVRGDRTPIFFLRLMIDFVDFTMENIKQSPAILFVHCN
jgi:hypothetical protein